jgi:hypothetical protein
MIKRIKESKVGYTFVPTEFQIENNPHYLRFIQNPKTDYRSLSAEEIQALKNNNNYSSDWSQVLVSDEFNSEFIRNSKFYGLVRIGKISEVYLQHKRLTLQVGIYNSTIVSSDIGDFCAVHDVKYMSYYIIENDVVLHNISEIQCTDVARFGKGIVKDGEAEKDRIWLEVGNETGNRAVLMFPGILTADVYLWSKYRGDQRLLDKFKSFTQVAGDERRGAYGVIGEQSVIKGVSFLMNSIVGPGCYIKGANKIKNVYLDSTLDAPINVGEGVELVNGIMGKGSKAFYGVKAVRFVLGQNSALKYGARLINSVLGENSTISCCEVLNSLLFPNHEQHHNNSFLIASTCFGQSNLAAGATIGSNHNSRINDGEIVAGRGFWPGLSVTLKHHSKFASFTIIVKGNYPSELNVPFPFTLVSNNTDSSKLVLRPAYWFNYNMYALERNSWKFGSRDKRADKIQPFEYEYLAPDTALEIVNAVAYLENLGKQYGIVDDNINIEGKNDIENYSRGVQINKVGLAISTYKEQVVLYLAKALLAVHKEKGSESWRDLLVPNPTLGSWINLGSQLMPEHKVKLMLDDVKKGKINSWTELHLRYAEIGADYPQDKLQNALACAHHLGLLRSTNPEALLELLTSAVAVCSKNVDNIYSSREKDFSQSFRKITCETEEEFLAVFGRIEDNSFVNESKENLNLFAQEIKSLSAELQLLKI